MVCPCEFEIDPRIDPWRKSPPDKLESTPKAGTRQTLTCRCLAVRDVKPELVVRRSGAGRAAAYLSRLRVHVDIPASRLNWYRSSRRTAVLLHRERPHVP